MSKSFVQPRPLTASLDIAASPQDVWALVADVRRTGEWSPECVRVLPIGRLRRGGLLLGVNRRAWVRWATLSRVHSYEPGLNIGWTVLTNRAVWSYRLEPHECGTRLIETRRAPRGQGMFAMWFTKRLLGGQVPHDDELEAGMQTGLLRIKELVEVDAPNTIASGH